MGEALKELGKAFYTIAIVILTASVIHPWVKGSADIKIALVGSLSFVILITVGVALITVGEKLKS
ncbi:MAG: hypothetical protein DSZ30_04895 [Aquificaceae bacterium]|nr:MAG: hypothetical protein DSZ30_04895 [Aquificaceae bacterium]